MATKILSSLLALIPSASVVVFSPDDPFIEAPCKVSDPNLKRTAGSGEYGFKLYSLREWVSEARAFQQGNADTVFARIALIDGLSTPEESRVYGQFAFSHCRFVSLFVRQQFVVRMDPTVLLDYIQEDAKGNLTVKNDTTLPVDADVELQLSLFLRALVEDNINSKSSRACWNALSSAAHRLSKRDYTDKRKSHNLPRVSDTLRGIEKDYQSYIGFKGYQDNDKAWSEVESAESAFNTPRMS